MKVDDAGPGPLRFVAPLTTACGTNSPHVGDVQNVSFWGQIWRQRLVCGPVKDDPQLPSPQRPSCAAVWELEPNVLLRIDQGKS
jgi:hypothetical protein